MIRATWPVFAACLAVSLVLGGISGAQTPAPQVGQADASGALTPRQGAAATALSAVQADLAAETRGRVTLVESIALCEVRQDFVSRDLLTHILDDTEEHIDFLETQLNVISRIGVQNYLQSQYELSPS
jgi:hypothetical protein